MTKPSTMKPFTPGDIFLGCTYLNNAEDDHAGDELFEPVYPGDADIYGQRGENERWSSHAHNGQPDDPQDPTLVREGQPNAGQADKSGKSNKHKYRADDLAPRSTAFQTSPGLGDRLLLQ